MLHLQDYSKVQSRNLVLDPAKKGAPIDYGVRSQTVQACPLPLAMRQNSFDKTASVIVKIGQPGTRTDGVHDWGDELGRGYRGRIGIFRYDPEMTIGPSKRFDRGVFLVHAHSLSMSLYRFLE